MTAAPSTSLESPEDYLCSFNIHHSDRLGVFTTAAASERVFVTIEKRGYCQNQDTVSFTVYTGSSSCGFPPQLAICESANNAKVALQSLLNTGAYLSFCCFFKFTILFK